MPSDSNRRVAAVVAALTLAYAVLITTELLLGLVAAGLLGVVVLFGNAIARDLDHRRWVAVNGLAVATLVALVVVGSAPLAGVAVGALVVLLGWVTAPRGPVARAVRWVRNLRADVRAIRRSVEADGDGGTDADPGSGADD